MAKSGKPLSKTFGRAHWSRAQLAFFKALTAGTTMHSRKGVLTRVWQDKVALDIFAMPDDTIQLNSITAFAPGKGHGAQAMNWLLNLADTHRIRIKADVLPEPDPDNPLADEGALRAWYERRGFTPGQGRGMVRVPRNTP